MTLLTLLPVWVTPVLVTHDGPRHVYNAALAAAVNAGRPPYTAYFRVVSGVRPDAASFAFLERLGPPLGWDMAERLLVTLAMAGTLIVVLALVRARNSLHMALLAPLAAWLASNWFVWVGMYDFALSVPCYGALLLILERPFNFWRHLALQLSFAVLYLTHIFTFAVGIALVAAVLASDAIAGRGRWAAVRVVLPALALLLIEVAAGGPGAGGWSMPADRFRELLLLLRGDIVVSATVWDVAAGVTLVLAMALTVGWLVRTARVTGWRMVPGAGVFGAVLILGSLIAPHGIGEGTLIPNRMRFLGAIALLPSLARFGGRIRPGRLAPIAGLLLGALVVHTTALLGEAKRLDQDRTLVDRLLVAAGAREGAWVARRFTEYPPAEFNVTAYSYRQQLDRVAVRRRLVVLDNFEALYEVFPTTWRARPDWLTFRPSTAGVTVRLVPGAIPWPGGVYVLHEQDRALQVADPRLELGPSVAAGPFAVTLVRRRG